jgi:hypothetical protein
MSTVHTTTATFTTVTEGSSYQVTQTWEVIQYQNDRVPQTSEIVPPIYAEAPTRSSVPLGIIVNKGPSSTSQTTQSLDTVSSTSIQSSYRSNSVPITNSVFVTTTYPTIGGTVTSVTQTLGYNSAGDIQTLVPSSKPGHNVGVNAAAGIGIGCAIVGALVASAAFFFFAQARRRRGVRGGNEGAYGSQPIATYSRDPKRPIAVTVSIPETSSAAIIENSLPQPKEDNAIIGELSTVQNRTDSHVQKFYQVEPVNHQAASQALVQIMGGNSPVPIARLTTLLASPRSRPAVLCFTLAWIIMSRIGPDSVPRDSFLPANIAGAVHALPESKLDDTSKYYRRQLRCAFTDSIQREWPT